jgi:hypothetical protein
MELHRPRQWGACRLASTLYEQLGLDRFWAGRLPASREGTRWDHVLATLVRHRLIDPGSEWRLHRLWFARSAMGDILGEDFRLVEQVCGLAPADFTTLARFSVTSASRTVVAGSAEWY